MIRVQNLSKYYSNTRALGPVSFDIEDGETVGFLGLNGAGKTTALRILACDLKPSSGTVAVGDVDALANPHDVRKRIGFLPESPPLYMEMRVTDFLHFAGRLRNMTTAEIKKRMPEVLDLTNLEDVPDHFIGTLSHGYRQRVGIAQAIIHQPQLLILDEPTRGLDPVQIVEMRSMIKQLKAKYTVLISSHILTEISQTCDRLLVLGAGKIIASGDEHSLAADALETNRIAIAVRGEDNTDESALCDKVYKAIENVDGVTGVEPARMPEYDIATVYSVDIVVERDVRAEVNKALVEAGFEVVKLDRSEGELESIFLNLVGGGRNARN